VASIHAILRGVGARGERRESVEHAGAAVLAVAQPAGVNEFVGMFDAKIVEPGQADGKK